MTLNCLHGFLGRPEDWDLVFTEPFTSPSQREIYRENLDLLSPFSKVDPNSNLNELGSWVNTVATSQSAPRVLLGYSLGGRIALHSLIQAPENWAAAIIVSAHPGLPGLGLLGLPGLPELNQTKDLTHDPSSETTERQARQLADEKWAQAFETRKWDDLIQEWDAQAVFQSVFSSPQSHKSVPISRFEKDYSRQKLASALRKCSLAHQMDLRPQLRQLPVPILWISGEQDAKYRLIVQESAKLNPRFKSVVIAGGGHRVPWERPREFRALVGEYLETLWAK